VRAWVVIDRAGDNHHILRRLAARECDFTLRSKADRHLVKEGRLRARLAAQPVLGTYEVKVARNSARRASVATMEVRSCVVWLPMQATKYERAHSLSVTAVWVRETVESAALAGRTPLDWMLYTNRDASTRDSAKQIVTSYTMRWQIEEFHRTWKNGGCRVEQCQMRTVKAVTVWASILAANAVRIERIKRISRTEPDSPASAVFSETEVEALIAIRLEENLKVSKTTPTVLEVTQWVAQLGGWISANGPPGSITLARGLDRLKQISKGFEVARRRFNK
jgi:Transposase DDE domain